jgi:hypothetical protein
MAVGFGTDVAVEGTLGGSVGRIDEPLQASNANTNTDENTIKDNFFMDFSEG